MEKSSEKIPWDDLVFKDRNKEYGAYDIRRRYKVYLALSLIATLIFAFGIVSYFFIDAKNSQLDEYNELFQNLSTPMDMNDLASLIEESKPLKKPEIKKVESDKIDITDSLSIDSAIIDYKNELEEAAKHKRDSLLQDLIALAQKNRKKTVESDSLYLVYDLPKFPGGPTAFNAYINRRVMLLPEVKANNIHGMVQICFSIDELGYPNNIYVKESINPKIDSAICEIFKTMPRWTPSEKYNKNLKVIFDVPIIL